VTRTLWRYALSWGGGPEDLLVVADGVATAQLVAEYTREALADERSRPGMLILVDYRKADLSQLTQADLDTRLTMMTRDATPLQGSKLAIVVGRAVDFGIMRMLHQRGDLVLESAGVDFERHVFESMEEARAWLATFAARDLEVSE
jgi:hypothetical protein